MRIPTNRYLVKVDSKVNHTVTGPQGMKFFRALNIGNVEWYKNTFGKVLLVPENFTSTFPTKCTYKADGENRLIFYDKFYHDIQPGDGVYFNYHALKNARQLDPGKLEYVIGADDINAFVRDGEMFAQAGRCIFTPITEKEWEERTGNERKSSIIIPDWIKQVSFKQAGKVVAVGKEWKGWKDNGIEKGDIVIHTGKRVDWLDENKKLGSLYYVDINCILKNEPYREDASAS